MEYTHKLGTTLMNKLEFIYACLASEVDLSSLEIFL